MCKTLFRWWLVAFLLAACERGGGPRAVGSPAPRRVVAGSASAVDYLCCLGAFDRVVAMPEQALRYANGLPADLPRGSVRLFPSFRSETLLTLSPGLVVCDWYQAGSATATLQRAGVCLVVLEEVRDLAGICRNVVRVGRALGLGDEAAARARALGEEARRLREDRGDARPTVLPYFDLGTGARTAGRGTVEDLMIELAGGRNAAADLGVDGHGPLPVEKVLLHPPRFILTGDTAQVAALRASPAFADLEAVRQGRVLLLASRHRDAASPYVLESARVLRGLLREHGVR